LAWTKLEELENRLAVADPDLPIAPSALDSAIDGATRSTCVARTRKLIFEVQTTHRACRWADTGAMSSSISFTRPEVHGLRERVRRRFVQCRVTSRCHRLPRACRPVLQADGDGRSGFGKVVRDRACFAAKPVVHLSPRHVVHERRCGDRHGSTSHDDVIRFQERLVCARPRVVNEAHGRGHRARQTFGTELGRVRRSRFSSLIALETRRAMFREAGHDPPPPGRWINDLDPRSSAPYLRSSRAARARVRLRDRLPTIRTGPLLLTCSIPNRPNRHTRASNLPGGARAHQSGPTRAPHYECCFEQANDQKVAKHPALSILTIRLLRSGRPHPPAASSASALNRPCYAYARPSSHVSR